MVTTRQEKRWRKREREREREREKEDQPQGKMYKRLLIYIK